MSDLDFVIEAPLFHTDHVIRDMFDAADKYLRLFDRAVLYTGHSDEARRRAAFILVAEVWIELVLPDPDARGFLDRCGEHLRGIAFKVRGIDELADSLSTHGVRFSDASGTRIASPVPRHGPILHPRHGPSTPPEGGVECQPDWWSAVLYTYMRDAHGWYEFCEPKAHHNRIDPRRAHGWSCGPVVGDPLNIVRGSHCTVIVKDLKAAVSLWTTALRAIVAWEGTNEAIATHSVIVRVGEGDGTFLELAQPIGVGPAARDYDACQRDILHCVNFLVGDLDPVRSHLAAIGCPTEVDSDNFVTTDPAWLRGARYGFTTRPIP
jgi:hypothetical protein